MNSLADVVEKIVKDHVDVLLQRIEQQWDSVDDGTLTDRDIYIKRLRSSDNGLTLSVEFNGLGAFIIEYGSGSLMVTSLSEELGSFGNPSLSEYMASSDYNNLRYKNNNAITGRAKGEVVHSPTKGTAPYTSKGSLAGRNLEKRMTGSKLEPLRPFSPRHIVETEFIHWLKELESDIDEAVEDWIYQQMDSVFKEKSV